eukprot:NODE_755_length_4533_cov_0.124041.p3 type:complete len:149 gc:universal NODE_755_length_4533_cov_0.124041:843-1289(+)
MNKVFEYRCGQNVIGCAIYLKTKEMFSLLSSCCPCFFAEVDDDEVHDPLLMPESKDQTSMQSVLQQTLDKLIDLNIYTIHSINRLSMYAPNTMHLSEKEITPYMTNIPNGELMIGAQRNSQVLELIKKALPMLEIPVQAYIFINKLEK